MVKVLVMYDQPIYKLGFEQYYQNVHLPLAKRIPNLKGLEIHRVLQTKHTMSKLYLVAELQFEDLQKLKEGMDSPEGQAAQEDVLNLLPFLEKPPVIMTVE